ncbi:hypothetical protein K9L63_01775 [Candidatus Gracilibacteria bacterium]|nr:hypothetical protein [Candidatus Gracilibacteria bacterium]
MNKNNAPPNGPPIQARNSLSPNHSQMSPHLSAPPDAEQSKIPEYSDPFDENQAIADAIAKTHEEYEYSIREW